MQSVCLEALSMCFTRTGGQTTVFENLNLNFEEGTTTTLLGPSACGKTTLLRLIAKLESPTKGSISTTNDSVGYALQHAPMLPWRTLAENAAIALELSGKSQESFQPKLNKYFRDFGLDNCQEVFPDTASGGMSQRAALIRTLVASPSILLLDEPFSNLDFDIKLKVQRELIEYQKTNNATIILVTHDIEDAIALSDRVIIFSEKPTRIKSEFKIELQLFQKDPVQARLSADFRKYFQEIWDELKYLDLESE